MSVSVVVKNAAYTTGEGPLWEESTQSLLSVDTDAGDVHKWNSETGQTSTIHLGEDTVSFIVPRRQGGYVIGHNRRIAHLDWEAQTSTTLTEVDKGENTTLNDAKCDASGRLWTGTLGPEPIPAQVELGKGSLYSVDADLTVRNHEDKMDIPNGLAWSMDNRTMYFIDSIPRKVWAYDFDLASGSISNKRCVFDLAPPQLGFPDGMTIDTDGNLWVACYSVGRVIKIDPVTGTLLQAVDFPALRTTSVCFGGKNYDELYVTSGKFNCTDYEFNTLWPLAGSIFKVTGLGVKGLPPTVFEG